MATMTNREELIQGLKNILIDSKLNFAEEYAELTDVEVNVLKQTIDYLSTPLPSDIKNALEYLSEYCGEDIDNLKRLLERLARDKSALEYAVQSYAKSIGGLQQRIKELEAQLKTAYGYGQDGGEPPWMK